MGETACPGIGCKPSAVGVRQLGRGSIDGVSYRHLATGSTADRRADAWDSAAVGRPPGNSGPPQFPRLRSVSLWNVGYASDSLPWAQLTTLALLNTEPSTHCVSILLLARNLVRLRVYTRRSTSDARPQNNTLPDRIELPLLETLVLDNNEEPPDNWLSRLVLPSLRRLAISCELLGSRWKHCEFTHLDAFMARCRPPLEHLQVTWGLGYFDLPGPGLAHVLQASFSAATIRLCQALSLDDKSWTTDRYWNVAE
uniref:F-box domain-containing protein n=1 Tax=Mycena chlorophos TaxID=658473 RepID=A0ABQ0LDH3_MYCCL|nr:predicted protein [Mycena chlorophos]